MKSCFHCGDSNVDSTITLTVDQQELYFCCTGCLAACELITNQGWSEYYSRREEATAKPSTDPTKFDAYQSTSISSEFLSNIDGQQEYIIAVDNIHCIACCWLIEKRLGILDGILSVDASFNSKTVSIQLANAAISLVEILKSLAELGYTGHPIRRSALDGQQHKHQKKLLIRMAVAGICAMQVMMLSLAQYIDVENSLTPSLALLLNCFAAILSLPVVTYCAIPFWSGALATLTLKKISIDTPIIIAVSTSYIWSIINLVSGEGHLYFDSVSMLIFLLLCSRFIKDRAVAKVEDKIKIDARKQPLFAHKIVGNDVEHISAKDVLPGDKLLLYPGEAAPVDCCLTKDSAEFDQCVLTGESLPVIKKAGDKIKAGSVLLSKSTIEVCAKALASQSYISTIELLIKHLAKTKSQATISTEKYLPYFSLAVLSISALTFFYWYKISPNDAFQNALSVLVIACPCAVALAIPTVFTVAIGELSRRGCYLLNPNTFIKLKDTTICVFDKTGTLTTGTLQVSKANLIKGEINGLTINEIAKLGASQSNHPASQSIYRYFNDTAADFSRIANSEEHIGKGIETTLNDGAIIRLGSRSLIKDKASEGCNHDNVLLSYNDELVATFELNQDINPSTPATLTLLAQLGIKQTVLSGDNDLQVRKFCESVSINNAESELRPQEKLAYIQALQDKGEHVTFVGDGANDAPSIAAANFSIATNNSVALTKLNADAVLVETDLTTIPSAIVLAKQAHRKIKSNLAWVVAYNAITIPFAALGLITPWMAVIGMSISSIIVVGNSLTLSSGKKSHQQKPSSLAPKNATVPA